MCHIHDASIMKSKAHSCSLDKTQGTKTDITSDVKYLEQGVTNKCK